MTEAEIQTKIKEHLETKGYLVVKIIQSSKNGWPDLQAMKNGVIVFIEVKRPGEALAPLQVYRQNQIMKAGFEYIIATSVRDIAHLK